MPCTYDLEVAASKYFDSLPDGVVPLSFHFNGTVLYRGQDDRLQVVLVPWSSSTRWGMPVEVWQRTIAAHFPGGGWIRLERETLDDARAAQGAARAAHVRRRRARAAGGGRVSVETLLTTLLYEGYALYPYTPGATKNATPTPFGIVYPPVYAAGGPHTFDRARMQLVLDPAAPDAPVGGTLAFLEPSGERHQGVERRIELGPVALDELIAEDGRTVPFAYEAVEGSVRLAATPLRARWRRRHRHGGLVRIAMCVHNIDHGRPTGLDRAAALRASLLSTHLVATAPGSRFASPVDPGPTAAAAVAACDHINIFPVLAGDADDTVIGATIVLPDHPRIAPESHGDLFDATEIEEALLLHVLALSDAERAAIAEQDPAVRALLARAEAAGPEEIARVRGRVTISDLPPAHRPGPADVAGEPQIRIDGIMYRRGAKVVLRPGFGRAPQDGVWANRVATIERIYRDYEDGVHLAVTVDDDPGQELMRDIGRYLYFKPAEVEVVPT